MIQPLNEKQVWFLSALLNIVSFEKPTLSTTTVALLARLASLDQFITKGEILDSGSICNETNLSCGTLYNVLRLLVKHSLVVKDPAPYDASSSQLSKSYVYLGALPVFPQKFYPLSTVETVSIYSAVSIFMVDGKCSEHEVLFAIYLLRAEKNKDGILTKTIREIASDSGFSYQLVFNTITLLLKKGWLKREKIRGVRVFTYSYSVSDAKELPLYSLDVLFKKYSNFQRLKKNR